MTNLSVKQSPKPSFESFLTLTLCFLRDAIKRIFIFGLLGVGAATAYLFATPERYEATAQIMMAQINSNLNTGIYGINLQAIKGVNLEDPVIMAARMSLPTSYSGEILNACGYSDNLTSAITLSKNVKITVGKAGASIVELKVTGPSSQVAKSCANALFESIKAYQARLISPYIEEARASLLDSELRLKKTKEFILKEDKSGAAVSAIYLSTREEINHLLQSITIFKQFLTNNGGRSAHLISPIYSSNIPIGPKRQRILIFGLLVGLLLGLFISIVQQRIDRQANEGGKDL